ncbi:endoplasmic reticulum membrane sensor NFE2L1b isoform X1 [Leucoraja erinacea]|uniref:endoplasmic reticulum membrane sensor NFE2L1b isoform X1 n=1 Tax=Leucoraja erinaceus TaxID=7782 RepID=UPI002457DBA2|nr:endoplasmic reticulum membrane sensor NFE2L1b isoform X1 [Leucoraja erinacea]
MHPLKKYFTEGLIQFTILLSLMGVRVDVDTYLNAQLPPLREIILGQSSAYTQTQFHNWRNTLGGYDLHPKSVDLDYYFTARRLLNDVRGLDRLLVPSTELSAWLVHSGSSREADGSVPASQPSLPLDNTSGVNEGAVAENSDRANGSSEQVEESLGAVGLPMSSDLTKEDIDLIDILWRQDIDLGAGREVFDYSSKQKENGQGEEDQRKKTEEDSASGRSGLLQGTAHVDGETGESIPDQVSELVDQTPSFEECLRLLEETFPFAEDSEFPAAVSSELNEALDSALASTSDSPPASSQTTLRPPLLTPQDTPLDLEQQWQDLLSLMDLQDMDMGDSAASFSDNTSNGNAELPMSYIQPPTTTINQDVSLHDATLPLCGQDFPAFFNADVAVGSGPSLQPLASTNSTDFDTTFGSTNFTGLLFPHHINGTGNETCSPAMADPLRGLLDDAMLDEISLMDLAMEEGFGPMETSQIEEELDSDSGLSLDSSQSPVSPSSSESSSSSTTSSSSSSSSSSSLSLSEEGAVGYSSDSEDTDSEDGQGAVGGHQPEFSKFCRMSYQNPSYFHSLPYLDQIHHNHTYNLPPGASASSPHSPPSPGYKAGFRETRRSCIDLHVGRDERRARALKIPFTNDKIVNLPVDEFNELLKKAHLTEPQLALIRDIRRRGKNKLAAQNCRKRKLDTILNLDQDVEQLKKQKARLLKEKVDFVKSLRQMKQKLQGLYQEVFDRLRDEDGRPYCPSQYTLQYANNGSMLVMPHTLITQQGKPDKKKGSKKK